MIIDKDLYIHQVQLGPMDNFLYILADLKTKKCVVVDPAWNIDYLITHIKGQEFELEAIYLTHGHPDHVNGVSDLLIFKNVPIYLSSRCIYTPPSYAKLIHTNSELKINDNKEEINLHEIPLGSLRITVIPAPGHSPGGQCFLYNKTLIAGDTVFIDGCGHCRLPGSNVSLLFDSIQKIKNLDDDITIFPGHDYGKKATDTIGNQKKTNPYFTNNYTTFKKLRTA